MTAGDDDLLTALRLIAERAGKIVLAHYIEAENEGLEVRRKSDDSPVTAADEACEAFILDALAKLTPEIPTISEEAAQSGGLPTGDMPRLFWLVDPLDGTKEFITRNGEFTVNIGLVENGQPVAGVVHAPALAMTWAGAADRATFSEADQPPMAIEARRQPEDGATVVASRRHGAGPELDAFLANHKVKELVSAGSSLKFCLIASGKADIYPRFGRTMEWDTCAAHAVLRAAGGRVETLDGRELAYGKPGLDNPHFIAWGRR